LAAIVDVQRQPIGIAGIRGETVDFAITPNGGQELKNLGGGAGWIGDRGFGESNCLSPAIDHVDGAVVAAERGERIHDAVGRFEGKTDEVGAEAAEIFSVGIRGGGFGLADGFASVVYTKRDAVGSAERAKVDRLFPDPDNGMR